MPPSPPPPTGKSGGSVLDATRLDDARMQAIAADIGYAETVFVTEARVDGDFRRNRVRYFSPIAEVPFCGHATIALAVALSGRDGTGTFVFDTAVGPVAIETAGQGAAVTAASPVLSRGWPSSPTVFWRPCSGCSARTGTTCTLTTLRWSRLPETGIPFSSSRNEDLDSFVFDPDSMRTLLDAQNWAGTVTTLCEIGPGVYDSRNLFPVGTITEDPATGSAAAAFGGYLRLLSLVEPPSRVVVHQGSHVGRPSVPVEPPGPELKQSSLGTRRRARVPVPASPAAASSPPRGSERMPPAVVPAFP